MNTKKGSAIAWLVAVVGLLAWEAYVLSNNLPGDTLSEAVWNATNATPLVPFLVGVVCSHFFWQRSTCKNCGKQPW